MASIREIVETALRCQGADGLVNEDGECGCSLDDLMPCENSIAGFGDCKPAYEKVCPCCGEAIFVSCGQLLNTVTRGLT